MKVCIATYKFLRSDGQGRVNYEVAQHIARSGHDVTVIATAVEPALLLEPNITWRKVTVPPWAKGALLRQQLFSAAARKEIVANDRFAIVQTNGSNVDIPSDVNASHFVHSNWLKSPYHVSRVSRGSGAYYQKIVSYINALTEKKAYRNALHVVAVSEFVKKGLVNDAGVSADKITVISNGVDTDEFRPLRDGERNLLREAANLLPEHFVCFFSGGIATKRKNLDITLNAIARLGERYHLVVAGSDAGSPYPALAEALGIARRIHFLGHRNDVRDLIRGADAFPFASHYDPFPLAVLEAMASGVPVITAPSVGTSAVITNEIDGFVLPHSNDVEGLAVILARLAKDIDLRKSVGVACRNVAQRFTWDRMAQSYLELFLNVAELKKVKSCVES